MNKFFNFFRGVSRLLVFLFFVTSFFILFILILFKIFVCFCSLINYNELPYYFLNLIIEHKAISIVCFVLFYFLFFYRFVSSFVNCLVKSNPSVLDLLDSEQGNVEKST